MPNLHPFKALYGIVGHPVINSRSPQLHNAAYRQLGIEALYLPFDVLDFEDFWHGLLQSQAMNDLGLPIKGLTTVSPFKEKAVQLANEINHPLIAFSKASNLLVKQNGKWLAKTTDSTGVIQGLEKRRVTIKNLKVAVIGCGGAGRNIAYALTQVGAKVTLVNRSSKRGQFAANLLNLPFVLLNHFNPSHFQVIINATPLGKKHEAPPIDLKLVQKDTILIDMIYNYPPTPFSRQARLLGFEVIDGFEIFNTQVQNQFLGMIGKKRPKIYSLLYYERKSH